MNLTNKSVYHAMIDIETLDTERTAQILSISWVIFDITKKTLKEAVKFHKQRNVLLFSQKEHGLTASQNTLDWWKMDNRVTEFKRLQESTSEMQEVLQSFSSCLTSWKVRNFWCNSPNFDAAILENAFNAYDMRDKIPWKFYQLLDVRTCSHLANVFSLFKTSPEEKGKEVEKFGVEFVKHNPLCDCLFQILQVLEVFSGISSLNEKGDGKFKLDVSHGFKIKKIRLDIEPEE